MENRKSIETTAKAALGDESLGGVVGGSDTTDEIFTTKKGSGIVPHTTEHSGNISNKNSTTGDDRVNSKAKKI